MVDFLALANKAATTEDQTVVKESSDFEYTPPPAGKTVGRFIGYIELGKQPQRPYQGKAKPPAEEVRLVFELLHPKKNFRKIVVDGKEETVTDVIGFTIAKKLGDKAKFKKIFDLMRYGRADKKHMAQMLGEAFVLTVFHNESEKDGKKQVYANLNDAAGNYGIGAPVTFDPITEETKKLPVPEATRPIQIFLFDHPSKETWSSLFIDGHKEVKNGAETIKVSRNWLQEKIMSATNFSGSALHTMLNDLADLPIDEPVDDGAADHEASMASLGDLDDMPAEAPSKPVQPVSKPAATSAPKPTQTADDDALSALGLVA